MQPKKSHKAYIITDTKENWSNFHYPTKVRQSYNIKHSGVKKETLMNISNDSIEFDTMKYSHSGPCNELKFSEEKSQKIQEAMRNLNLNTRKQHPPEKTIN